MEETVGRQAPLYQRCEWPDLVLRWTGAGAARCAEQRRPVSSHDIKNNFILVSGASKTNSVSLKSQFLTAIACLMIFPVSWFMPIFFCECSRKCCGSYLRLWASGSESVALAFIETAPARSQITSWIWPLVWHHRAIICSSSIYNNCKGEYEKMLTVSVMAWFHRNTPDPAQESQGDGYSKPMLQALSAVCVRSPDYGTRSVSFLPPSTLMPVSPTAIFSLRWLVGQWS